MELVMNVILDEDRATLLHGESKDLGEVLGENTVDAIVTDPPAGIGFMGKDWDDDRGGADAWSKWLAETLAPSFHALKPGGHILCWAIPRTSHWTARALELAGFEIRDVHHDILSMDDALAGFVASLDDVQRQALARVLESQTSPILYHLFGTGFPKSLTSKSAEIPEWSGSALKPAVEHWILARKPLEGSYAENYKKWGTGVLNIDGCRVSYASAADREQAIVPQPDFTQVNGVSTHLDAHARNGQMFDPGTGRWPAHLSLDEETAKVLDEQSGTLRAPGNQGDTVQAECRGPSKGAERSRSRSRSQMVKGDGAPGGASRFFYVAKAPRKEKDAGLDHLPKRSAGEATDRDDGSAGLKSPRAGAGRTGGAKNFHPTVKNVALMKWLVRLVTPPGGIVLDPFAGSGTTGVAALQEGFSFIGCEQGGKDGEYLPILVGRIRHALGMPPEPQASTPR